MYLYNGQQQAIATFHSSSQARNQAWEVGEQYVTFPLYNNVPT